jgi:hypothetical protein
VRDRREAGLEKPLARSAALSSNEVADAARLIRCHCLAHGRCKFSDLEAVFPHACPVVRDVIGQVVEHDAQAREDQLRPAARLAYHQAQSPPLMDGLKRWLDPHIDAPRGEPNSALGKALGSMRTPGETLRRFLTTPGAPSDNNLAERVLKLCSRQRQNALFYKNSPSADIASVLTRLLATCSYAGVHAGDSLVALQEHRREVFLDPAAWRPWAYASSRASPSATRRQSWAIWARSGAPFPVKMMRSRADRGTRAAALVGHHAKRPVESRCIISQSPWPS